MKKVLNILGILAAMVATFFLLTKLFLYYANRPLDAAAIPQTEQADESKEVLLFIGKTHESFNGFLNYGKAEKYNEGDWKQLRQWFAEQESALKDIHQKTKNKKVKEDLIKSYELAKLGVEKGNIQLVIYSHRIYHDLDIILNRNTSETNIWGYTEFGNGENIKIVEEELQKHKNG
ncbi:MAG: hypothetical protein ACE3JP_14615 [Ectobacillus sp.]